mmetsp:Transcript_19605/g.25392  ORF Transcript_19605/g.25392 Transcript_19605/m.25392 type:complete len:312 (-) Transcript_19605:558-1493(-)|eukprot:CAMPEP_0116068310 /NCGR_PEP_ID=MMETSP0322-20121206/11579_1 /TAXON_ID=163516 /ORGANISM="Leptocylindrus danicus var. apora, Strain B651" /LENGTH=311 /DNA_ID=CAMNT_0003555385 /DNA_START=17 /DNA_END=952 /DNA_ORIENTATION=-
MSDSRISKLIPAKIRCISGCHDAQTSADVFNVSQFQLPDPAGKAGGACTSALLKVLRSQTFDGQVGLTWVEVLKKMRAELGGNYTQIPQLTSSQLMNMHEPFRIVPEGSYGRRRAVLIGINYRGQQGELRGCHNDALNVKKYLIESEGFLEDDIRCLFDDGIHMSPTRANIEGALRNLAEDSYSGDVIFLHYSGHGGFLKDEDGDEDDGYDETLIPVDFQRAGQIRDDDIFKMIVGPLREGVTMTALMDCCHSGTVMDLPYRFVGDGESDEMERDERFDTDHYEGIDLGVLAVGALCCLMELCECLYYLTD